MQGGNSFVECLIGPDSDGLLYRVEVDHSFATGPTCTSDICICNTDEANYAALSAERIAAYQNPCSPDPVQETEDPKFEPSDDETETLLVPISDRPSNDSEPNNLSATSTQTILTA